MLPLPADAVAARSHRGEAERARWVARREPPEAERVNWWLFLLVLIESHMFDGSRPRTEWVRLNLWALRQMEDRAVLPPYETAMRTARLVSRLAGSGEASAAERIGSLPTPDEAVRRCLDLIPLSMEEAAMPFQLSEEHLEFMIRSRQAKNLVNSSAGLKDELCDEDVADRLHRWLSLRSNLV